MGGKKSRKAENSAFLLCILRTHSRNIQKYEKQVLGGLGSTQP